MTMDKERDAIDAVADTLASIRSEGANALVTLSNGIVLRCRPLPPLYIQDLNERFQPPPPPKVYIEGKDREEENPADPEYQRHCGELALAYQHAAVDLFLGLGTELVTCPEGIHPPESDEWVAWVKRADKFAGTETPIRLDDPDLRYLSWLRFYAVTNNDDLALAGNMPTTLGQLHEEDVARAVDNFRRLRERPEDSGRPDPASVLNGHRANRASRRAGSDL